MPSHFDTIVAPITGASRAAVAIVRISGEDSWRIARELFPSLPKHPEALRLHYGWFSHGDDGYLALFEAEKSFTGEAAFECSIHGSPASVQALVDLAVSVGARPAEPGEFTLRAFLNGRIDLTQAEAVRDTVEAQTAAQFRVANRQREGILFRQIEAARQQLIRILASVEAAVDFSEEIGELDRDDTAWRLVETIVQLGRLIETGRAGRLLRNGLRVALIGRPNAGKSSLLNALVGTERSIVAPTPGTTRDYVEESIEIDGFPIVLTDTAGLRRTDDPVEGEGVLRSRKQTRKADLAFYLYDSTLGWTPEDQEEWSSNLSIPSHVVETKADLPSAPTTELESPAALRISTVTGENIGKIRDLIRRFAGEVPEIAIAPRHELPLANAIAAINEAHATLKSNRPSDLASVSLREAISALGEITGETADPDMITRIFHDFCIGK